MKQGLVQGLRGMGVAESGARTRCARGAQCGEVSSGLPDLRREQEPGEKLSGAVERSN